MNSVDILLSTIPVRHASIVPASAFKATLHAESIEGKIPARMKHPMCAADFDTAVQALPSQQERSALAAQIYMFSVLNKMHSYVRGFGSLGAGYEYDDNDILLQTMSVTDADWKKEGINPEDHAEITRAKNVLWELEKAGFYAPAEKLEERGKVNSELWYKYLDSAQFLDHTKNLVAKNPDITLNEVVTSTRKSHPDFGGTLDRLLKYYDDDDLSIFGDATESVQEFSQSEEKTWLINRSYRDIRREVLDEIVADPNKVISLYNQRQNQGSAPGLAARGPNDPYLQ